MTRLAFRRISILSTLALSTVAAIACGSGQTSNTGGTGSTTGGANLGGGATSGGKANGGGSSGGGSGQSGGAANSGGSSGNSGGTQGNSGGNASGGGASDGGSGGGAPTGGAGTGGSAGGGNNPVAGTDKYDCSAAATGAVPALTLTKLAGDVDLAVDMAHAPNDDRLFVITLNGTIRIFQDGNLVTAPFLDISSKVAGGTATTPGDERGLLGIAFHPDYATNGLFYVHYNLKSATNSDSRIEEYKVSSDPNVADPASAREVLTVKQPGGGNNHKGGAINFGPNKLLFIGLGDGGGSGDMHTPPSGQSTDVLLGKILRINPLKEGDKAYTTPADNLIMDVPTAKPEIWDYGLRNPFRSSIDGCTGDLYIGDVGQNDYEEVDMEKAGEGRKNYGWNKVEGCHPYPTAATNYCTAGGAPAGVTLPQIEVPDEEGTSITGGAVYRGKSIPELRGAYFYADYVANKVWYSRFDRAAGTASAPKSVTQELAAKTIVAIRNGNDGELYFVALGVALFGGGAEKGGVYKLEADN
jgi:glucose/arabinose dehydrogenase